MRIVFLSNFLNHHQKPLSEELFCRTEGEYAFVETKTMDDARKKLGWGEKNIPQYVFPCKGDPAGNNNLDEEIVQKIENADAVVIGSAPLQMIAGRLQRDKLVFRYAERPLKNGNSLVRYIPRWVKWHKENPKGKPIYMLCASAYTASDYAKFGLFQNKAYKWGYFPEAKCYDIESLLEKKDTTEILWCGRFLDWKHPDDALYIAKRLKEDGYKILLTLVGTGDMEQELHHMTAALEIQDCVRFVGAQEPAQVRKHMEKAGIYLFISDRQEGWGAVLNEAMNSGCAVVASDAAGATPFLVKDNENGFVYKSGDLEQLYQKVKRLLDDTKEQARLGRAAYRTITDQWNAQVAAQRLLNLTEHILAGEKSPDLYADGPCSKA